LQQNLSNPPQPTAPEERLEFFTRDQAQTIEAVMACIFPDDDLGPGAIEAGAVYYLDRSLAGAERYYQAHYRGAVLALDTLARARHRADFRNCTAEQQDTMVTDLAEDAAPEFGRTPTGTVFFELLRAHTLEGVFSDPAHGGNRNLSGWKLLGYPGPQPSYSHAEQQLDAPILRDRIFTAADYPLRVAEER
jgi:gluconate 2-dehydrogenase gamma chain